MSFNAMLEDSDGNNYLLLSGVNSFVVYSEVMSFTAGVWYAITGLDLTKTNSKATFSSPVDIRAVYDSGTLHLRSQSNVSVRVSVVKLI